MAHVQQASQGRDVLLEAYAPLQAAIGDAAAFVESRQWPVRLSNCAFVQVAAQHPQQQEALKQVLCGRERDWRSGTALHHLAALGDEEAVRRLCQALAEPGLWQNAARAIYEKPPCSADAALVQALRIPLEAEQGAAVKRGVAYEDVVRRSLSDDA